MARVVVSEPTRCDLLDLDTAQVRRLRLELSYEDLRAKFELRRHRKSRWYAEKYGEEAFEARSAELAAQVKQCLLFESDGRYWTHSGLAARCAALLGVAVESAVAYPEPEPLGYERRRPYPPYPYQSAALAALLDAGHGAVEIGTGCGKSFIIEMVVKEVGGKVVVMAPSRSIARQLLGDLTSAFGRRKVGLFGDGKKESHKQVVVAIAASLTRLEEGDEHWEELSSATTFCADESHQCPADTLAKVCFGLLKSAPYRFFFSATQTRTDGLEKLLEAIVGPIVYRLPVRDAIAQGYLAPLRFVVVESTSSDPSAPTDANEATRRHLYYNDSVCRQAAAAVNSFVADGRQVLVLVEELEQFTRLLPLFRYPARFAHGGVTRENRDRLPEAYWDSDPVELVAQFNAGEFPILVGTSCISVGTDVKANELTVNLQGGKSFIGTMQGACGRSTRLFEFGADRKWGSGPRSKAGCTVLDFRVGGVEVLERHAAERVAIYREVADVEEVRYAA